MKNLCLLPEERLRMCVYFILLFFFPRGDRIKKSGPKILGDGSFERKLKVLVPFLSDQKNGGQLGPLPRSFFPKVTRSKF